MNRTLKVIFCIFFFTVCLFFSLATFIPGTSKITEGGIERPSLVKDGFINDDFGTDYEEYFSRAFAYRGYVVDLWSQTRAAIGEGNDQVVVGKDNFLFFAETIDSYTGNPMTDDEIKLAADAIENLAKTAASKGAGFLFATAPDKNTIYPEKMPARYIRNENTDLDRLFAELSARGLDDIFIDLRPILTDAKNERLVYHRRDTHWNQDGALTSLGAIADRLGFSLPDMSTVTRTEPRDLPGDLDALLFPGKTLFDVNPTYDLSEYYIFTSAYSTPMDMQISTRGAGSGKALVFRDSFGNAMIPLISSSFAETRFERANPYRIDLLDEFHADDVILIIAERNLHTLIGSDSRAGAGNAG